MQPTSVPAAYGQRLGNGLGPVFSGMGHYERPRGMSQKYKIIAELPDIMWYNTPILKVSKDPEK